MGTAQRRIAPNSFGFAFGLAGLAETWLTAAADGHAPHLVGTALTAVAAAVWSVVLTAYLGQLRRRWATLRRWSR